MTLDKHKLEGIVQIKEKTLPVSNFESLLTEAGYTKLGETPAKGTQMKSWWRHETYPQVEAIYSANRKVAITAYHVV